MDSCASQMPQTTNSFSLTLIRNVAFYNWLCPISLHLHQELFNTAGLRLSGTALCRLCFAVLQPKSHDAHEQRYEHFPDVFSQIHCPCSNPLQNSLDNYRTAGVICAICFLLKDGNLEGKTLNPQD